MARAPFQVLVIPYRQTDDGWRYALFRRSDGPVWQGIAGGGEDDETPAQAAVREAAEEGGIEVKGSFVALDATASIRADCFPGADWGPDVYVVPEHAFAVELDSEEIQLSEEHLEYAWLSCEEAMLRATFDSSRTAVWELDQRLRR